MHVTPFTIQQTRLHITHGRSFAWNVSHYHYKFVFFQQISCIWRIEPSLNCYHFAHVVVCLVGLGCKCTLWELGVDRYDPAKMRQF